MAIVSSCPVLPVAVLRDNSPARGMGKPTARRASGFGRINDIPLRINITPSIQPGEIGLVGSPGPEQLPSEFRAKRFTVWRPSGAVPNRGFARPLLPSTHHRRRGTFLFASTHNIHSLPPFPRPPVSFRWRLDTVKAFSDLERIPQASSLTIRYLLVG
jgi:hypothetical protein